MRGGTRPKTPKLLTSVPELLTVSVACDSMHEHEHRHVLWSTQEWSFATRLEAEYRRLLCQRLVEQFYQLSGEGHKGLLLECDFDVLGMRLSLGQVSSGKVTISNKPGRVQKICEFVDSVEREGSLNRHQDQVLIRYQNIASGFFQGRALKFLCRDLVGVISGKSLLIPASRDLCVPRSRQPLQKGLHERCAFLPAMTSFISSSMGPGKMVLQV